MPTPAEMVKFCPQCGAPAEGEPGRVPFQCRHCGLHLYFNPTVATAIFLFDSRNRCLFLRRANEPAKGKLGVPGGFVDFDETIEAGMAREVMEEVGIKIREPQFLCSRPNRYDFRGIIYPVCDLVFTGRAVAPQKAKPLDEVHELLWRRLADIDPEELAFPSMRLGWKTLMNQQAGKSD